MDFPNLRKLLSDIGDPNKRQIAETIFADYEEYVVPRISSFEQAR